MRTRCLALLAALGLIATAGPSAAQFSDGRLRIGVLADMSGVYSDFTGQGSVVAAQMAVDDCLKAECAGMAIDVVSADHQNKADVGSTIARQWIDRDGVDVLTDMSNASLQLALPPLLRDKNRIGLFLGGTARLTGDACMPSHVVQWMWDTYAQAAGVVTGLTKPGRKWFLVTADYAFGHQFEADTKALLAARGGTFAGSVRHPFPAVDLSSQLLTAQGSGADVVAFANAGADTIGGVKAARDFGMNAGAQTLAAFFLTVMDVRSIGLEAGQGTVLTEGFYWDLDEGTRRFSARFRALRGTVPSVIHAGIYSSVRHYLKAAVAAKTDEAGAVIARMHALPIADDIVRNATLRPDGRMVHDYYLFRVKKPSDSKSEWDLYDLLSTLPGDQVFRPLAPDLCKALNR